MSMELWLNDTDGGKHRGEGWELHPMALHTPQMLYRPWDRTQVCAVTDWRLTARGAVRPWCFVVWYIPTRTGMRYLHRQGRAGEFYYYYNVIMSGLHGKPYLSGFPIWVSLIPPLRAKCLSNPGCDKRTDWWRQSTKFLIMLYCQSVFYSIP